MDRASAGEPVSTTPRETMHRLGYVICLGIFVILTALMTSLSRGCGRGMYAVILYREMYGLRGAWS